jgi:FtsP/CotA-like multicopper oxidase with cupredoxin domain
VTTFEQACPRHRDKPLEIKADNPGQWMAHCHNAYHGALGMMTVVSYVA